MSTALDIPQVNPEPDEIISIIHDIQTPPETLVPYQNLSLIKKLNNNKFPINLVFCQASQQYYVMKVFPYLGRYIHPNFSNELRFTSLNHPNIVSFVHSETKDEKLQGNGKKASYILMEYAPYGDFCNFIGNYGEKMDEKLVRTYFRQLIEGVEHLHKNGVVHLDLKPDNLLLGADFNLKITDFDLSYKQGDTKVSSNGTKYLRAPEFFRQKTSGSTSKATCAADIYSAGIILFILKSRGHYPHTEDTIYKGINLIDLMYNDNEKFWEKHCKMGRRDGAFFEDSFRELFNKMTKENPGERVSISEIKESEWYNGPVYTPVELTNKMKELLNCCKNKGK